MKGMHLLKKYLKEISKYPLLTPEEEKSLSKRVMEGDKKALTTIINANLRLVVKISIQYYKGAVSIMDIIQNGNIGLMKAAEKYDYRKEVKFSTYAAFWIKQSILRGFIKPSHNVNISYRKDAIDKKIRSFVGEYQEQNGRYPTVDCIVEELKVNRRDAIDVLCVIKRSGSSSLNENVYEGEEIIDTIADNKYNPEKVVESLFMMQEINQMMDSFPTREKEIIRKRFGFDQEDRETLQSLGKKFSITAEAARQIEKRVLIAMKQSFSEMVHYYLY